MIKNHQCKTPHISNGGLLVMRCFVHRNILSVPRQIINLNSGTAHTRERYSTLITRLG